MATPQTAQVIDPTVLAFVERLIDKGWYPTLIVIGAWYLVAKFGWPWRQDFTNPPPTIGEKSIAEALNRLSDKVDHNHAAAQIHREEIRDGMSDLGQRVARIEGRMEGL